MKNFHIETINTFDNIPPYLKVYFEECVDEDLIMTWLNSSNVIKHANVDHDDYYKVNAKVYPYEGADMEKFQKQVTNLLTLI